MAIIGFNCLDSQYSFVFTACAFATQPGSKECMIHFIFLTHDAFDAQSKHHTGCARQPKCGCLILDSATGKWHSLVAASFADA